MPGRPSTLTYNVHKAILEVLEEPSYEGLSLSDLCKVEPSYIAFFGLPSSKGHRRLVVNQKSKYKQRRITNPKNYARDCFNFGVEVSPRHPVVFEWVESFKEDREDQEEQETIEEAETMSSSAKRRCDNRPILRRDDYDDDDDDEAATVGLGDDIFGGKKKLV